MQDNHEASAAAMASIDSLQKAIAGPSEAARTGALRVLSLTAGRLWSLTRPAHTGGAPPWWLLTVEQLGSVEPHLRRLAADALTKAWHAGARHHSAAAGCLLRSLKTMFAAGGTWQADGFALAAQLADTDRDATEQQQQASMPARPESAVSSLTRPPWLAWLALPLEHGRSAASVSLSASASGAESDLQPDLPPPWTELAAALRGAWASGPPPPATTVAALEAIKARATRDSGESGDSASNMAWLAPAVVAVAFDLRQEAEDTPALSGSERQQRAVGACLAALVRAAALAAARGNMAAVRRLPLALLAFFARARSTPATTMVLEALAAVAERFAAPTARVLAHTEMRAALHRLGLDRRWEVRDAVLSVILASLTPPMAEALLSAPGNWWQDLRAVSLLHAALRSDDQSFARAGGLRLLARMLEDTTAVAASGGIELAAATLPAVRARSGTGDPTASDSDSDADAGPPTVTLEVWPQVAAALESAEGLVRAAGASLLRAALSDNVTVAPDGRVHRVQAVPALGLTLRLEHPLLGLVGHCLRALEDEDWEVRLDVWSTVVSLAGARAGGTVFGCAFDVVTRLQQALEDMHEPVRQW